MWIRIFFLVSLWMVAVIPVMTDDCRGINHEINVIWKEENTPVISYKSVEPGKHTITGNDYIYMKIDYANGILYQKVAMTNNYYCTMTLQRAGTTERSMLCENKECRIITDMKYEVFSERCLTVSGTEPDFIQVFDSFTHMSLNEGDSLTAWKLFKKTSISFPLNTADKFIWFKAKNLLYQKYTASPDEKIVSCGINIGRNDGKVMLSSNQECQFSFIMGIDENFQCTSKTHHEISMSVIDKKHEECWKVPYPNKLSVFVKKDISDNIFKIKFNLEKLMSRGDIPSGTPSIFFEVQGVSYEIDESSQSQELACPIILLADLNENDNFQCKKIDKVYSCIKNCVFGSDSYYSVIAVHWNDQPKAYPYNYYKYLESWMDITDSDSIIKVYSNTATTGAYYILDDNINIGDCKIDLIRDSAVNTLKCNFDSKICSEMTVDGNTELTNRACLDLAPSIQVSFLKFNLKEGVSIDETISHSYRRVENGYFSTIQGKPFIHKTADDLTNAALFVKDDSVAHKHCYHVYDTPDQHEPETMPESMDCDYGYKNFLRCKVKKVGGCQVTNGIPTCHNTEAMAMHNMETCEENEISINSNLYKKIDDNNLMCMKKLCNTFTNVINLKPHKDFQTTRNIDGWYIEKALANGQECQFTCNDCTPLSREILYDNTNVLMSSGSCPEHFTTTNCDMYNNYKYIRLVTVSYRNDIYCNWDEKPMHIFQSDDDDYDDYDGFDDYDDYDGFDDYDDYDDDDDINEDCLLSKSGSLYIIMEEDGNDKLVTFNQIESVPPGENFCDIETTFEYADISVMCSKENNNKHIRECKNIRDVLAATYETYMSQT